MYLFEKPLIRGTLLKRKSQFTALIDIGGEELIAHIPTTNRIGDVENKNLPCLLSYHDDPKRKLKYDIEAVLLSDDENWIGINQILSNRLVEFFFQRARTGRDRFGFRQRSARGESGHFQAGFQSWRYVFGSKDSSDYDQCKIREGHKDASTQAVFINRQDG